MITVYYFEKYDIGTNKTLRSDRRATREAITRVRGTLIESTALEIDERELDGDGFQKPTPDG